MRRHRYFYFVTGRNKRALVDHFDSNQELEFVLLSRDKHEQAEMVRNILPNHVERMFVRQPEQLGLGHAVLCAERAVAGEPFAVLLADYFLTDYAPGVTSDLVAAFERSGKCQLSVMQVDGLEISKYGVIDKACDATIDGLVEKTNFEDAPSNLDSIGRYVLSPTIFEVLRDLPVGSSGEIQLADATNRLTREGSVEAVTLKGLRFDCGSVEGLCRRLSINLAREKRKMDKIFPVLPAGGSCAHLRHLSRKSYPKQFSNLIGSDTLSEIGTAPHVNNEC